MISIHEFLFQIFASTSEYLQVLDQLHPKILPGTFRVLYLQLQVLSVWPPSHQLLALGRRHNQPLQVIVEKIENPGMRKRKRFFLQHWSVHICLAAASEEQGEGRIVWRILWRCANVKHWKELKEWNQCKIVICQIKSNLFPISTPLETLNLFDFFYHPKTT